MFTECGKEEGRRGGTIGHATGDESNTLKVCCKHFFQNKALITILFPRAFPRDIILSQ